MDHLNIYDDVGNVDLGTELHKLENQNQLLLDHIHKLERDIEKLCSQLTNMKQAQQNLSKNISELFKTAKIEIERKDRIISELREEIDGLRSGKANHFNTFKRRFKENDISSSQKRFKNDLPEKDTISNVTDDKASCSNRLVSHSKEDRNVNKNDKIYNDTKQNSRNSSPVNSRRNYSNRSNVRNQFINRCRESKNSDRFKRSRSKDRFRRSRSNNRYKRSKSNDKHSRSRSNDRCRSKSIERLKGRNSNDRSRKSNDRFRRSRSFDRFRRNKYKGSRNEWRRSRSPEFGERNYDDNENARSKSRDDNFSRSDSKENTYGEYRRNILSQNEKNIDEFSNKNRHQSPEGIDKFISNSEMLYISDEELEDGEIKPSPRVMKSSVSKSCKLIKNENIDYNESVMKLDIKPLTLEEYRNRQKTDVVEVCKNNGISKMDEHNAHNIKSNEMTENILNQDCQTNTHENIVDSISDISKNDSMEISMNNSNGEASNVSYENNASMSIGNKSIRCRRRRCVVIGIKDKT